MLDAACPGDVFAAPPSDYVYETTQAAQQPEGRPAHHQQLHRRQDGLRHGPRARRGRGHQDRHGRRRRRRGRQGLDLHGRPPRRGGQLLRHQGTRRRVGARAPSWTSSSRSARGSTRSRARWAWRSRPARRRPRAPRCSSWATTRSRWASASTASRGGAARRSSRANEIIDEMLEAVVTDLPYESGDEVALMINGLGGTPISELYILYGRAHEQLAERGITVGRSYVGEYCTSLDMAGASRDARQARRRAQGAVRGTRRDRGPGLLTGSSTHRHRAPARTPGARPPRSPPARRGSSRRARPRAPAAGPAVTTASAERVRARCSASDSPPGKRKEGSPARNAACRSGLSCARSATQPALPVAAVGLDQARRAPSGSSPRAAPATSGGRARALQRGGPHRRETLRRARGRRAPRPGRARPG